MWSEHRWPLVILCEVPFGSGRQIATLWRLAWPRPSPSCPCVIPGRRPRSSIKEAAIIVNQGRMVALEDHGACSLGAEKVVLGWMQKIGQACNRLVCHRLQNSTPNLAKIYPGWFPTPNLSTEEEAILRWELMDYLRASPRLFELRFISGASGKTLPSHEPKPSTARLLGSRMPTLNTLLNRVCVIFGRDSVESLGLPSIIINVLPLPPVRKMEEK